MQKELIESVEYKAIEDDTPVSCPEVENMTKEELWEEYRKLFGDYPTED